MQTKPMAVSEARKMLRAMGVNGLLSPSDDNPKLAKSLKIKVMSAPLHLAPARLSGYQVCPKASQGCIAACLNTAGNPAYAKGKARARLARTKAYFQMRDAFLLVLCAEIARHVKRARDARMRCAVRLNATSDIRWESVPVVWRGRVYANVMAAFPRVQFYDYTAIANRKHLPTNYHLTFSLKENNDADALQAYRNGMNIAVVMDVMRTKPLPHAWTLQGVVIPVIDGDVHDYRPADGRGIVGLRAKGKARTDKSGFVRSRGNYSLMASLSNALLIRM